MSTVELPRLGDGVYTFPEAARILRRGDAHPSARQLRYWMTSGLAPASHTSEAGDPVLNFVDLVSLEVVSRFRARGVSLHRIRQFEARLRDVFPVDRPFAYEVFFTDGASLWADVARDGQGVIELIGRRQNQYAWTDAIRTFAQEIRFDPGSRRATSWALSPWIEIDPSIQFGMPVVAGTRVTARTVEANLAVGSPQDVAAWFGLTVEQVEGVRDYLALA